MFLTFVGGLMNLAWVGGIALFVLVEKAVAKGDWLSRLCGTLLIVWVEPIWLGCFGVEDQISSELL